MPHYKRSPHIEKDGLLVDKRRAGVRLPNVIEIAEICIFIGSEGSLISLESLSVAAKEESQGAMEK